MSKDDARGLVEKRRLDIVNGNAVYGGRKVNPEEIQRGENGWYWVDWDGDAEDGDGGLISCEMEFHALIWPSTTTTSTKTEPEAMMMPSSPSSESSSGGGGGGGGGVPAEKLGEKGDDVDMLGSR